MRLPGREEVQSIRPQDRILQAVPVPSLRQRPYQGRAGPVVQGRLDGHGSRRPVGGEGPRRQGGQEDRVRAGGVDRGVPRVLRQLQGGRRHGRPVGSQDVRLGEPLHVHGPRIPQPHHGHVPDRAAHVPRRHTAGAQPGHTVPRGGGEGLRPGVRSPCLPAIP